MSTITLTRDEFLKLHVAAFPKYEEVSVAGLGVVWVKKLNAGEQDRFEVANSEAKAADFRARLVVACCINQQGASLFDYSDIPQLSQFDAEVLDVIVEAAWRMNPAFGKEYREAQAKNLNGQAESSSVASV